MVRFTFFRGIVFILVLLGTARWSSLAECTPTFNRLLMAPKGSAPPNDFSFPDLDGKINKLSKMKGKVVFLVFFATWCPLCNEEMPKFAQLYEKYQSEGLVVLAVSVDRVPSSFVQSWTKRKNLTYTILHDQKFVSRKSHNVRFVPTIYLLDRNLQLVAWAIGQVDWNGKKAIDLIEKLLKKKVRKN